MKIVLNNKIKYCKFRDTCLNCTGCDKTFTELKHCEYYTQLTTDLLGQDQNNLFSKKPKNLFEGV